MCKSILKIIITLCSFSGNAFISAQMSFPWSPPNSDNTLVLSHIVFRHGDRTPDPASTYPNDPYANQSYYPYGKGQLTLKGKQRAYKMGVALRERYNKFLGPVFLPDTLEAVASQITRTHMTMQVVLAGLYPATISNRIDNHFSWQPIPYTYLRASEDKLIFIIQQCPAYSSTLLKIESTEKWRLIGERDHKNDLYTYLSKYVGWNVTNLAQILSVQDTLLTQEQFGLILPSWTKLIWPDYLTKVAEEFWKILATEMTSTMGGNLFKKIVDDTTAKIKGIAPISNRKLFLYSGHDITVAPLLGILGNYERRPPYSSYVIIELHKVKEVYGIKAYYQDYKQMNPRLLTIPNCASFCPWDAFVKLTEKYIPDDNWCKE